MKKVSNMAKCSFCSQNIETGTGIMLVRNDGKILRFDSHKCERNMTKLRRDPRAVGWVRKMESQ